MHIRTLVLLALGWLVALPVGAAAPAPAPPASGSNLPHDGVPVASPNRITSSQMIRNRPPDLLPRGQTRDAVSLVDADGRTLGRMLAVGTGNIGIATTVNGRETLLMGVMPLGACNGDDCTYGPGLQWGTFAGALLYESADCSGPPSTFFASTQYLGFDRVGVTVRDGETDYMYLSEARPRAAVIRSTRFGYDTGGQCYSHVPLPDNVMPVVDVIPVSRFGRPPFSWR